MTIEEFWNRAFLAALTRLSVAQAKAEADEATQVCIHQWQSSIPRLAPERPSRWQDQDIGDVPRLWTSDPNPIKGADRAS